MLSPQDPAAFRADVLRRAVRLDRRRRRARRAGAVTAVAALLLSATAVQVARSDRDPAGTVGLTASAPDPASPLRVVPLDLPGLRTPWAAVGAGGGALWVLDRGGDEGPVVRRFEAGRAGTTAQLPADAAPEFLVAGTDEGIWMTDPPSSRVFRVGQDGGVTTWSTEGPPSATAVFTAERLWFADRQGARLRGLGPDGSLVDRPLPDAAAPDLVAGGPDGSIWFGDADRAAVGSVSPSGGGSTQPLPAPDQRVLTMATGPGPSLWLLLRSDGGLRLGRVDGRGQVVDEEVDSSRAARGLTQGPDGSIWFTSGDGTVLHRRSLSASTATRLDRPLKARAWALGTDGTVWAVDGDRNQVVEVRPS